MDVNERGFEGVGIINLFQDGVVQIALMNFGDPVYCLS
jgi:hypothetical protein